MMHAYDGQYPQYGFAQHKGYGTASHMSAIHRHGPCPIHRMTFAPLNTMRVPARGSSSGGKPTVRKS